MTTAYNSELSKFDLPLNDRVHTFKFNLTACVFLIHLMKKYIQLKPFVWEQDFLDFIFWGNNKSKGQVLGMSIFILLSCLLRYNTVKCWASLMHIVSCGIYTFLDQRHYLLHQRQTLSSFRIVCNILDFCKFRGSLRCHGFVCFRMHGTFCAFHW